MSFSDEQIESDPDGESDLAAQDDDRRDAHVADDVSVAAALCVARVGARKRRREGGWMAAIVISLCCHGAIAAAWWEWRDGFVPPVFSINGGRGGTPGEGITDDDPAVRVSDSAIKAPDMGVNNDPGESVDVLQDEVIEAKPLPPSAVLETDVIAAADDSVAMSRAAWLPGASPVKENHPPQAPPVGGAIGGVESSAGPRAVESNRPNTAPLPLGGGGGDGRAIVAGLLSCERNDPPEYPRDALRRGKQGTVLLELLVGVDGRVHVRKILQSSGVPELDNSAWRKVDTYVVSPGYENGVPVETIVNLPVRFMLPGFRHK